MDSQNLMEFKEHFVYFFFFFGAVKRLGVSAKVT